MTNAEYKMYINNSTNYTDKVEMGVVMNAEAEGEAVTMDIGIVMNNHALSLGTIKDGSGNTVNVVKWT